jgi:hypothetical protein
MPTSFCLPEVPSWHYDDPAVPIGEDRGKTYQILGVALTKLDPKVFWRDATVQKMTLPIWEIFVSFGSPEVGLDLEEPAIAVSTIRLRS